MLANVKNKDKRNGTLQSATAVPFLCAECFLARTELLAFFGV